MGRYRRRLDIVAEILRIAATGARKTRIMQQCNLSYRLLERYLADVVQSGLVQVADSRSGYVLTEEGRRFLERFESYAERFQELSHQSRAVAQERDVLTRMISSKDSFKSS